MQILTKHFGNSRHNTITLRLTHVIRPSVTLTDNLNTLISTRQNLPISELRSSKGNNPTPLPVAVPLTNPKTHVRFNPAQQAWWIKRLAKSDEPTERQTDGRTDSVCYKYFISELFVGYVRHMREIMRESYTVMF